MSLLHEYVREMLQEFECPPMRRGHGDYYRVDTNKPPSVEEVHACWMENRGRMLEDSMPVMYDPRELAGYREYKRSELRNPPGTQEYQALRDSIEKEGIREPLHLMLGKKGGAKIGEGNHRHEIAMELGLPRVPVMLHFWHEVSLSDPVPVKSAHVRPQKKASDLPPKKREPMSGQQKRSLERDVEEIMRLLGG